MPDFSDHWIDEQLRDVPLPAELLPRLREIAALGDREVDHLLCNVAVPPALADRLHAIGSLTDTDLLPESGVDNMVVGVNSPTNFAGVTGSVNLGGGTPIPGDFTGDRVVNGDDLTRWRTNFGATGPLRNWTLDERGLLDYVSHYIQTDPMRKEFGNLASTACSRPARCPCSCAPELRIIPVAVRAPAPSTNPAPACCSTLVPPTAALGALPASTP